MNAAQVARRRRLAGQPARARRSSRAARPSTSSSVRGEHASAAGPCASSVNVPLRRRPGEGQRLHQPAQARVGHQHLDQRLRLGELLDGVGRPRRSAGTEGRCGRRTGRRRAARTGCEQVRLVLELWRPGPRWPAWPVPRLAASTTARIVSLRWGMPHRTQVLVDATARSGEISLLMSVLMAKFWAE